MGAHMAKQTKEEENPESTTQWAIGLRLLL